MSQKPNIITDIGTLTKVPNKILEKLVDKANLCIGSIIHDALTDEAYSKSNDILLINIGIGTLSIELKTMQCKFIPSKDLKNSIKSGIENKIDPLECELEKELADKLIKICTEVL